MKRKFIITTIMMIGMFLLVITNVSALSLKLDPSTIYINGEPNKEICEKLNIEYSVINGIVEGRDLWAEKNLNTKDLHAHNLSVSDIGLIITYPKSVTINGQKEVDICLKAQDEGLYHGALFYKTITTTGNTGIELNIWIVANITPLPIIPTGDNDGGNSKKSSSSSSSSSNSNDNLIILGNDDGKESETNNQLQNLVSLTGKTIGDIKTNKAGILSISFIILLLVSGILIVISRKRIKRRKDNKDKEKNKNG